MPERAGSVLGYQVAFCWRNTALYGGLFIFGLLYGLARSGRISLLGWLRKPAPRWAFVLLLLPMFLDGLTHLLGLRDMSGDLPMDAWYGALFSPSGSQVFSLNWWLRIVTGMLAALGAVWFAAPRMDRAMYEEAQRSTSFVRTYPAPGPEVLPGSAGEGRHS